MYEWKLYRKINSQEMIPYFDGDSLEGVSVTEGIVPITGGMIARDSNNHDDKWYIEPAFFNAHYEEV